MENNWIDVSHIKLVELTPGQCMEKRLTEWRKVRDHFPPSFYDVFVMNGKRKQRAYFDAGCQRWVDSSDHIDKHFNNERELKRVSKWMEIPEYTLEIQKNEYKNKTTKT